MPFVVGSHPFPGATASILPALADAGASVIEVGIPFSDPIADGPVIAAAMHEVLTRPGGRPATPETVFAEVASARARTSAGLVAMCSVSIVHRMGGADGFCRLAAQAGFDGLIVPDVTVEDAAPLAEGARSSGLALSLLVAPTTPPARAARIAERSSGFVYLLARSGTTGERADLPEVAGPVAMLRRAGTIPIACGFGIASPEQVRAVVRHADAAIVGSALVRRLSEAVRSGADPVRAGEDLTRTLVAGLGP